MQQLIIMTQEQLNEFGNSLIAKVKSAFEEIVVSKETTKQDEEELLATTEAMKFLKIKTYNTMIKYVKNNNIPRCRLGECFYYRKSDLMKLKIQKNYDSNNFKHLNSRRFSVGSVHN